MKASDIVYQIRKSTNLNQREFGKLVGLFRSSINQFERGARIPLPKHAKKYLLISDNYKLGFKLDDFY